MEGTRFRPVIVVGAGLIGRKRVTALDPRQRLSAVVDVDSDRAYALAADYDVLASTDLSKILESAEPGSLVIAATTHESLSAVAVLAAQNSCHVLVEKPGARSAGEFAAVLDAARLTGVSIRVGYNHRFHPGIRQLARAVRSGEFGQLKLIRARYGHGGRPGYENEWRAQRAVSGGGELLDQGSHLLDLTRFLAGDITDPVGFAETLHWPMEVEDNAFVTGRLPGGGRAWLHASWTEWRNLFSLEVFCETAKLEVSGLGGSYGPESYRVSHMTRGFGPPRVTTVQYAPGDESWAAEMADVENAIRGDEAIGASGSDALATLEVIAQVYAS